MKLWIDCETGGLEPLHDALLSVAIVTDDSSAYSWQIKAEGLNCTPEALRLNGLDPQQGMSEEDVLLELIIVSSHYPDATLAGCNVAFDVAFLKAAFKRHGLRYPFSHRVVDIQSVASFLSDQGKMSLKRTSLDVISNALGMCRIGSTHSALEDAQLTMACYNAMLKL